MPSMLVYQLKTANNKLDSEWVKNIDTSVLHIDFKYVLCHVCNLELTEVVNIHTDLMQRSTLTVSWIPTPNNLDHIQQWLSTQNLCWPSNQKWK